MQELRISFHNVKGKPGETQRRKTIGPEMVASCHYVENPYNGSILTFDIWIFICKKQRVNVSVESRHVDSFA